MTMKKECGERIARLQQKLRAKEIGGALLVYPIDVYYYAGTRQTSVLWVPAEGEARLLVRKSFSRAQKEACLAEIRPFPGGKEFASALGSPSGSIGLTFDVLPVQQFNYYAKLLPAVEFVDISSVNRELRSVKSAWELERMRYSGDQLCGIFSQVPEFLTPQTREVDLSAEFESRLRKAGGEGFVRMRAFNQELSLGIVAAGAGGAESGFFDGPVIGQGLSNASAQGATRELIGKNSPVLLDYTGVFEGYIVDMTRMFVCGRLDSELQRAFDTALEIQELVARNLRPGVLCSELFGEACAIAERAGLGSHFMGAPGEQAKFVGHGVGLELDEMPVLAKGFDVPLLPGQTVAVEPKFVFPGVGSVGIENTWAVSEGGGVRLTDMPDTLVCL